MSGRRMYPQPPSASGQYGEIADVPSTANNTIHSMQL